MKENIPIIYHNVPSIYTPKDDDEIMREFNGTMYVPTPKQGGLMTECLQNNIGPVCIMKINYIRGIRLDRPQVYLLDTGSTGTIIQNRCLPPGVEADDIKRNENNKHNNWHF